MQGLGVAAVIVDGIHVSAHLPMVGEGVTGELGCSKHSLWVGLALGTPTLALMFFPWCGHSHETFFGHGSFGGNLNSLGSTQAVECPLYPSVRL